MVFTIDQIRTMVQTGQITPDFSNPLFINTISNSLGLTVEYSIFKGWDVVKANHIDESWGDFKCDVAQFINSKNLDSAALKQIEQKFNFGDGHWDWFLKSFHCKSPEYEWFFLYAEDKPQAVCLIYHPKQSILYRYNIFYVEYIAVAPWNRKNPLGNKKFSGLGEILIQFIVNYAVNHLGLTLGFSLHSLPGAMGFYKSIGMTNIPNEVKNGLEFFEIPYDEACKYLEAS